MSEIAVCIAFADPKPACCVVSSFLFVFKNYSQINTLMLSHIFSPGFFSHSLMAMTKLPELAKLARTAIILSVILVVMGVGATKVSSLSFFSTLANYAARFSWQCSSHSSWIFFMLTWSDPPPLLHKWSVISLAMTFLYPNKPFFNSNDNSLSTASKILSFRPYSTPRYKLKIWIFSLWNHLVCFLSSAWVAFTGSACEYSR